MKFLILTLALVFSASSFAYSPRLERQIIRAALDGLAQKYPDFEGHDGNLEYYEIEDCPGTNFCNYYVVMPGNPLDNPEYGAEMCYVQVKRVGRRLVAIVQGYAPFCDRDEYLGEDPF